MPGSPIPSLNTVSLIGTVAVEARIDESGGKRSVTIGVTTEHGPGERTHRVVIQDEFLAQAVHSRLRSGALIHVTGELDQDDDGVYVAVVNRRGSDIKVIGGEMASEQAARPHAAQAAQRPAQNAVPSPAAPSAPVQGQVEPATAATQPASAQQATPRPSMPAPVARPAPSVPSRSPLSALSTSAPVHEQDDGGESDDEGESAEAETQQAAPVHVPAATHPAPGTAARITPSVPGARPPLRVPPSVGARPPAVAQPRPALPSGGPRPGMPNGALRPNAPKPLGAVKDDDDIPF